MRAGRRRLLRWGATAAEIDAVQPGDELIAFRFHLGVHPVRTARRFDPAALAGERYGYKRWWAPFVVEPTQAAIFVMSRRMLLGIRDRAERSSPLVVPCDPATERKELHHVHSH